MRRAQDEWTELIAEVEAERAAGTDPADPRLDPLIARWTGLIEQFTGGDPGIRASLQRLYDSRAPSAASRGAVNGDDDGVRAGGDGGARRLAPARRERGEGRVVEPVGGDERRRPRGVRRRAAPGRSSSTVRPS